MRLEDELTKIRNEILHFVDRNEEYYPITCSIIKSKLIADISFPGMDVFIESIFYDMDDLYNEDGTDIDMPMGELISALDNSRYNKLGLWEYEKHGRTYEYMAELSGDRSYWLSERIPKLIFNNDEVTKLDS